jgi:release factor glutamine methyltransferase
MTLSEADKQLQQQLQQVYDTREASNITGLVMENITGFSKTLRLVNKQELLTIDQEKKLQKYSDELLRNKPVQYVLHEAWFAGMKLYVDENVLIPRPETEELVQEIIVQSPDEKLNILDIGTGSGCIAIAIKKKLQNAVVYALDISRNALEIASQNAVQNKVEIQCINMDILLPDETVSFPLFDIIVSNPPYIRKAEAREMQPNVLEFEPETALFVPDNAPLLFYKAIANFALKHLSPGSGRLFFEINEAYGNEVCALLREKGFAKIFIKKDMQGKDRMVMAHLKNPKK